MDIIIGYLAITIVVFLISIAIMRAVFSIGTFIKLQRAQVQLLAEIAYRQGVSEEKITRITTEAS